jgi:hypothetical protein
MPISSGNKQTLSAAPRIMIFYNGYSLVDIRIGVYHSIRTVR